MRFPNRQSGPSFADVKQRTNGCWPDTLATLGVALPANGKHGPCSGCGGKDRFRFDNKDGDGTWICSQGSGSNVAGDGFALLQHTNGWDAKTALEEVAKIVDTKTPAKATKTKTNGAGKLVATYIYRDKDGKPRFGVERWEANGEKTFSQFTKRNGSKRYAVKDIPKIPYRLNTWDEQAHTHLWLCEGEKNADHLGNLGLRTTTNPGGATTWPDELTPYFKGYDVRVLEDNDDTGRRRSEMLVRKLLSVADSVKVIQLPNLPVKGDISDWLNNGHTVDELLEYSAKVPTATIEDASHFKWIDTSQPLDAILDGNWLIKGLLPTRGLGVLYGRPGSGKTFVALDVALHIAARKPWRGHITKGGGAAYVAMEGGAATINRVVAWKDEHDANPNLLLTRQTVDLRSSQDDADTLIDELRNHNQRKPKAPIKLIVIDTLNLAMAGGNENASEDMGAFVATVHHISEALECFVLVVHHSGKDEARGSRGHSSLLGAVDTELEVKRQQGQPGIIKLTKQRDGEDGLEFGFDLQPVLMGVDRDGQEVNSCLLIETDAAEVHKARRQQHGPQGKNQRRIWDALTELEATAIVSPGVMDIPAGALIVKEDDLYQTFVKLAREDEPDTEEFRLRESFNRALKALEDVQPAWIKKKGGNLWKI